LSQRKFPRSSGILLHPTSLPAAYGIGDFGPAAYAFADWLSAAGQKIWQVLPLGPTGYGDSPYQCFSAFAGNPLLISPEKLVEAGYLSSSDVASAPAFPEETVEFETVIPFKYGLLELAAHAFEQRASQQEREAYSTFCRANAWWLDDYALFMALKKAHGGEAVWTRWQPDIAARRPEAVERWSRELAPDIETQRYWQFEFFRQWGALKQYCRERGILMMGDVPIYVAHDSADVWSHPELFHLDEKGDPAVVAGVPPDYFSATGQLWGNPIYRWDRLAGTGYAWWIDRLRASLSLVDIVRLDHFRGFEAYWEVPAGEKTAIHGRWVKGPGADLLEAAHNALGDLPIVAENLGVITPEVEAIRNRFDLPGMSILQFAFGNDPQAPDFQPHNYPRNLVAYTGTHDNDTTVGWWTSTGEGDSTRTPEDIRKERDFARLYLGGDLQEINWVFIRTILASVADTALAPVQDVLGLGSEARMNLPGTSKGNWRWRFRPGALTDSMARRLHALTASYGRGSRGAFMSDGLDLR
jgi:4-alpha-glucanotransferase